MKTLAGIVSATVALTFVASVSAQRGGAARAFSGHSASSFHSSSAPSGRYFSGQAYRYSGPSFAQASRVTVTQRFTSAPSVNRSSFYSLRRPVGPDYRRFATRGGVNVPYAYPGGYGNYGWIGPGYTDVIPAEDVSTQPIFSDPGPQQDVSQQVAPTPSQPTSLAARRMMPPQPAPAEEDAVTLVFKDGRPSEQIHNYMLTRTMLYVRDQHRRDIPVEQLDLAATEKANQNNGVEFTLPSAK